MPVSISSTTPPDWFLKEQIKRMRQHNKAIVANANRVILLAEWYKNNMVYTGELYNDPIIPPWDSSLGQYQIFIKIIK